MKLQGHLIGIIKQHPALITSVLYIYFTLIGIIYSLSFISEFGINIVDFIELSDFLLIALSNYKILLVSGVLLIYVFVVNFLDIGAERKAKGVFDSDSWIVKKYKYSYNYIYENVLTIQNYIFVAILTPLVLAYMVGVFQGVLVKNRVVVSDVVKENVAELYGNYFDDEAYSDIFYMYEFFGLTGEAYKKITLTMKPDENEKHFNKSKKYILLAATSGYYIIYDDIEGDVHAVLRDSVLSVNIMEIKT